jgi:hypothetical protein
LGVRALNFIDQLEFEIQQVLKNPDNPIISGKYFASRETGLASGLSGLSLSLGQNPWKPIVSISDSFHPDVFSCELMFEKDSVAILNYDKVNIPVMPKLGDLFTGRCNTTWSEMALNLPFSYYDFESDPGPVIRKGLAHGELIREFVKWIHDPKKLTQNFATSENSFDTNGWCNGRSGFLVVSALRQIYVGEDFRRDFFENEFEKLLSSTTNSDLSNEDFGLCHGISGVLVTLAALARLLSDPHRISRVKQLYEEFLSRDVLLNLLTANEVDCSWLTGVAGVVWGYKVVLEKPTFNPLAPFDAKIFSNIKYKP